MARIYEDYEYFAALDVNLIDYLRDNGYQLRKEGKEYAVILHDGAGEHDSLKVHQSGKRWTWYSAGEAGKSPILLIHLLEGIDKPHAIKKLADYAKGYSSICRSSEHRMPTGLKKVEAVNNHEKMPEKAFALPEKAANNRRVFGYLMSRGIDKDIIGYCIEKGLLYEDKSFHNAVFVGQKDDQGKVQHAALRGTYTLAQNAFKRDVDGSDKEYSFAMEGQGPHLFVFESAIDAISKATLEKMGAEDWKSPHRVTLGGMSDKPLELYLNRHPEIKKITFILDNDLQGTDGLGQPRNHGQIRADKLKEKYQNLGYETNKIVPKMKDVNEDLMEIMAKMQRNQPRRQEVGLTR
ncbi:DUF3991 domain-containing protein [Aminipila butyrica]|uniref:DUF3991 domain-containing protein n=1 Tax=Aminipila butyrica TaxID=433296 RepID=A0A858BXF6_9FIRM|nr:DUF3991 and TOPRIM domain-containing protein [Aminipila butyrica]QIB69765.1 DUF3991 domain-containing protein [Aminipila butyrica]